MPDGSTLIDVEKSTLIDQSTLFDRLAAGCRFVIGEPRVNPAGWRWCSAPLAELGGAYCRAHAALAARGRRVLHKSHTINII